MPEPRRAATGRIALIVDDQAAGRKLLGRMLDAAGWTSVAVADGADALREFRARAFDLVLLDLVMPGMDGLEVLRHMRAHETDGLRRTRIVAVTAMESSDLRHSHLSVGLDGWIEKPVDSTSLLTHLAEAAAARPSAG